MANRVGIISLLGISHSSDLRCELCIRPECSQLGEKLTQVTLYTHKAAILSLVVYTRTIEKRGVAHRSIKLPLNHKCVSMCTTQFNLCPIYIHGMRSDA